MKEILEKLDKMDKVQNDIYKRLFVSNGKTALVEEVKQTKAKIEDHIKADNIVSCGGNRYINKIIDRLINGAVIGLMVLLVLGVQTWIKSI